MGFFDDFDFGLNVFDGLVVGVLFQERFKKVAVEFL